MRQLRGDLHFTVKPISTEGRGHPGMPHLDSDVPAEAAILSEIHRGDSAAPGPRRVLSTVH